MLRSLLAILLALGVIIFTVSLANASIASLENCRIPIGCGRRSGSARNAEHALPQRASGRTLDAAATYTTPIGSWNPYPTGRSNFGLAAQPAVSICTHSAA